MDSSRKIAYARRRTWSRIETRTLLVFAISRNDEFHHVFKKKTVHSSLLEDMTNSGVSNISYTETEIKNKLKSLKRAYKDALDNISRTGSGYAVEPYKDLLEELFDTERPAELSEFQTVAAGVAGPATPIPLRAQAIVHNNDQEILNNVAGPSTLVQKSNKNSVPDDDSDDLIEVSLPDESHQSPHQPQKKTRPPKKSMIAKRLDCLKDREASKKRREVNKQQRHQDLLKIHADQLKMHEDQLKMHEEERKQMHNELVNILKSK